MNNTPLTFGFRYRYDGHTYALDVSAKSRADAEARIAAISAAEFVSELHAGVESTSTCVCEEAPSPSA